WRFYGISPGRAGRHAGVAGCAGGVGIWEAARVLGLLSDYTAISIRTAQRPCPQTSSVGH
ncbi:hypothetical protein, partial [Escherichia coli]|uniref:hypothetical protein n=1 Tax=Escherichia coli TaxID=562 RepID=UPI001BC8C140